MKYLWSAWPQIDKKIRLAKRKLLILDFDGTLAKIAKRPHDVILEKETAAILMALIQRPSYQAAVVSGRSLANLKAFFNIKNIIYAGNHAAATGQEYRFDLICMKH